MAVKYITRRAEDKKWCVKNAKAAKVTRTFNTQKEAIEYAQKLKSTTSIMVQSREGKFRKISKWDGIKVSQIKSTTKKSIAKSTTKKAIVKKSQNNIQEKVIKELKSQNEALDKQLLAKTAHEAVKVVDLEATEINDNRMINTVNEVEENEKTSKSTSKKVALALGIIFFLIVIVMSVLLVLDWKNTITFMNFIK